MRKLCDNILSRPVKGLGDLEKTERRTAVFVNKLITHKKALSMFLGMIMLFGMTLPFYVCAFNDDVIGDHAKADVKENNTVNIPVNAILEDKTPVDADKVEYKTETRTENIAYGTTENAIDTIPKGTRELVSGGKNGVAERTYLVKYVNGNAVEQALYTEDILTQPVNEVVNVGVGGTVTAKDGTVYNYSYRKQMEATAYTYLPPYTSMTTATGATLRKGIVAVDPRVIPMHTKMFITGSIEYGLGVAEDTGGAIKGNIIDLAFMSYDECIQFGRRQMQVYILE